MLNIFFLKIVKTFKIIVIWHYNPSIYTQINNWKAIYENFNNTLNPFSFILEILNVSGQLYLMNSISVSK